MDHMKWKMGMIKRTCRCSYQKKRLSGDGYLQTDVGCLCLMVHLGLGTVGKVVWAQPSSVWGKMALSPVTMVSTSEATGELGFLKVKGMV